MEEQLNNKPLSYPHPFVKISATVRRDTECNMKDGGMVKQPVDLAVVPGDQTMNLWSTFACESETTLYDSNLDQVDIQHPQELGISDSEINTENCHEQMYSKSLPHPTKLRKKKKQRASTMKWSERKYGNIQNHLSQLKSKQVVRVAKSQLPQKLNKTKEFHYSQYQIMQNQCLAEIKQNPLFINYSKSYQDIKEQLIKHEQ